MSQPQTAIARPELYINTSITNSEAQLKNKIEHQEKLHKFNSAGIFQLSGFFNYNGKTSMTFSIIDNLKQHYVLIKGLTVFCRSRELSLNFNAIEKTITIDLQLADLDLVKKLMNEVSTRLYDELKFKTKLTRALEFEKRYKEEALLIYNS